MKLTDQETAALFREATARDPRGGQCLDEQLLLRAAENDLAPAERERVAAHIAECSDCASEYRVARAMRPFGADARAAFGRRTAWRWWAAAAAAVVIALFAWQAATVRSLQSQLQIERARPHPQLAAPSPIPQLAVPIVDLEAEPIRGAAPPITSIDAPKGAGEIALVLHLPSRVPAPAAVTVLDERGAAVWRGTVQQGLDAGAFTLTLPRALIPSGRYSVDVAGTSFPFRVAWQ